MIDINSSNLAISRQCDLLFIDTLHNYDQIKQELSVHVENNPNPPKTIIFHDVESFAFIEEQPYGENGGILPAILEFLSRENMRHFHDCMSSFVHILKTCQQEKHVPTVS